MGLTNKHTLDFNQAYLNPNNCKMMYLKGMIIYIILLQKLFFQQKSSLFLRNLVQTSYSLFMAEQEGCWMISALLMMSFVPVVKVLPLFLIHNFSGTQFFQLTLLAPTFMIIKHSIALIQAGASYKNNRAFFFLPFYQFIQRYSFKKKFVKCLLNVKHYFYPW